MISGVEVTKTIMETGDEERDGVVSAKSIRSSTSGVSLIVEKTGFDAPTQYVELSSEQIVAIAPILRDALEAAELHSNVRGTRAHRVNA